MPGEEDHILYTVELQYRLYIAQRKTLKSNYLKRICTCIRSSDGRPVRPGKLPIVQLRW